MAPKITTNTALTTSSSSSSSGKLNRTLKKPMSSSSQRPRINLNYALYLHREELQRRRMSKMRVSQTKLMLTHELITNTIKNIDKCSADDLQSLSRETVFKNNLQRHIARQRHHQYLQMLRMKQQRNATVAQCNTNATQIPQKLSTVNNNCIRPSMSMNC
ncbi:uncharacterized protein LOC133330683 [Musca vetustissima]|uniref:uncharacterized protein LOC133330683 n=1 Tax=Musca vetustissima TaxID=27455 RepID=UPI002AB63FE9|nr:uncharacterized protein LOC133330683 [Musca vetustissima]